MSTGGGGVASWSLYSFGHRGEGKIIVSGEVFEYFLLLLLNVYCVFIHLFMCVCAIVYLCVYARVRVLAGLLISKCNALV